MTRPVDDDDWFEALAGRPRPGTDPATLAEAGLLRTATRDWSAQAQTHDAQASDAEIEALVARARADGLLAPRGWCAGCGARWRRWLDALSRPRVGGSLGLALAVLLAVVIFGVLPPGRDGDDTPAVPVLRGAAGDAVWLLRADDPQALRERIAAELAGAGVVVTRYERLGRFGLDAELGLPVAPALADALRGLGVAPAADGSLRVEVEAAPP